MPETFGKIAALGRAIADEGRLRILAALHTGGELCGCDIRELLGFSGATVSAHMAVLTGCGLVEGQKRGRWVYYRLNPDCQRDRLLAPFCGWLLPPLAKNPQTRADRKLLREMRQRKCCDS